MKNNFLKAILICSLSLLGLSLWASYSDFNVSASKVKYRNVNGNEEQTLTLGLKGRDTKNLDRFIYQTVTPGNSEYRKYLTPQTFGAKYGLSNRKIKVIGQFMSKHHLKGYTYPGNIVMTISGKTKDIEKTFNIQIKQTTNQKHNYQLAIGQAKLNPSVNKYISFIDQLGLKVHLSHDKTNPNNQLLQLFSKIKDPNISDRSYRKFGRSYNTESLYKDGYYGQGQTIGIIGSADFKMSDIKTYLKNEGVQSDPDRIKKIYVSKHLAKDKGDQSEVTMDIEQSSAIAPKAKINAYLGNDFDSDYFIPSYATAIGIDNVDVISSSYGAMESDLKDGKIVNKGETELLNRLLKQAAAQGITTFNASGDNGAYSFTGDLKKPSVGLPAASPYITAVGGTTLPFKDVAFSDVSGFKPVKDNTISLNHETSWSITSSTNYLFGSKYLNYAKEQYVQALLATVKTPAQKKVLERKLGADKNQKIKVNSKLLMNAYPGSGGGFSTYFDLPDYQKRVSGAGTYNAKQWINFKTGMLNHTPTLIRGHQSGRNVPDISGNADPLTGYNIYMDGKYDPSGNGTSVITPQMAAMAAVINSAQNQRTGFWNPQIYRFAKNSNSPFTPLNSIDDNNLYYTGQPGKLYNQATGLGTVDFTKLNQAFSNEH